MKVSSWFSRVPPARRAGLWSDLSSRSAGNAKKDNVRRRVILFGRFPAEGEVGGVTTFIYNLSKANRDLIEMVVDFYPAEKKVVPPGVQAKFITGKFLIRMLKLFWLHMATRNAIFHHNFSTARGLFPLMLFPKRRGVCWILTLHNGDLDVAYEQYSWLRRFIVRLAIKRFDTIAAISEKQDYFYAGLTNKASCRVSPFVEAAEPSIKVSKLELSSAADVPVFVIAGFPTRIYRHLETILVFRHLWAEGYRFRLTVCLYGYDTDGIRGEIVAAVAQCPFATVHSHLDADAFQGVLSRANVYVRMNSVDSYGLIVAEAAQYGLTVLATNVCTRYPGTFLIKKDDFGLLKRALIVYLNRGDLREAVPVQVAGQTPVSFRSLYSVH